MESPDDVVRDASDRHVGQPVEVPVRRRHGRRQGRARRRQAVPNPVHEPPETMQETAHAFDAGVAPIEIALGGRGEQTEEPRRVGAVPRDQVVGLDDVAARFAHRGAVLDDHALGEEVAEGLVEREEAEIAQDFREEARVEEMQHRVFDAADVLVDAAAPEPVRHLRRRKRLALVRRRAVAGEVPGRLDEGVHRVGLTSCRPAAAAALRADERVVRRER